MADNIIVGIFAWVVGVIVALVVGSGMVDGTLVILGIPKVITIVSGWIVVVGAITSVIFTTFNK